MKKTYVRITRQIGFSYASTLIVFLINPLLVFLLTRSLSVEHYGVYAVLAATVNVAGVLLDLGLSQYLMSQLAGAHPKQRARGFFSLLSFLVLFLIAVLSVVLFTPLHGVLLGVLRISEYVSEFRAGLAIVLCITLVRFFTAYFAAQKRMVLVSLVFLMSQSLWVFVLLGYYALARSLSLLSVMTAWFAGALISLLVCGWLVRRDFAMVRLRVLSPGVFVRSLLFSLPLLFFITSSWAMEIGDRYLLNSILGSKAVGLYTLVYSLLGVVASLGTVVSQTFFPYIAGAWNRHRDYHAYLNAAVKYSLLIVLPALAGFLALQEQIVTLVSGEAYREAAEIIPALFLYPLFASLNYILYQVVLLQQRTVFIGFAYVVGAVLNIALNLLLIPRFSMSGAALATVASYALVFAMLLFAAWRSVRLDTGFVKLGRMLFATFAMSVVVWLINPATVFEKLFAIAAGIVVYAILVLMLRVFSKNERRLVAGVLPQYVRRFLP